MTMLSGMAEQQERDRPAKTYTLSVESILAVERLAQADSCTASRALEKMITAYQKGKKK